MTSGGQRDNGGGENPATRSDLGVRRTGRAAVWCVVSAVALILAAGLLGTSAAAPPLPGRRLSPPVTLPWHASVSATAWPVTLLLAAAALLGGLGVFLGLTAVRRGWRPETRWFTVGGYVAAIAVVLVPPMGSADPLDYAAYGRIAATGGSPYTGTAHLLAASGDPIGRAVEAPWLNTPSVYGPLGTAEQWLASELGGTSMHTTVFVLSALGAVAFLVTGALLRRIAGPDPAARLRVLFGFSLNPLVLFEAVNAAHIDMFGLVFVVAALAVLRRAPGDWRRALAAGVLVAAGCSVKVSLALFAVGLLWGLRRHPRSALVTLFSAVCVGLAGYAVVGGHALHQTLQASSMVSFAVPSHLLVAPLQHAFGGSARSVISTLGWVLMILVAAVLARRVRSVGRGSAGLGNSPGDVVGEAAAATALLVIAWLVTAPYSLPWYDVAAWAPLMLCASGPVDGLLALRTTMLTLAYLPGRDIPLPRLLNTVVLDVREDVAPYVGIVLLLLAVWLGQRAWRAGTGSPIQRACLERSNS